MSRAVATLVDKDYEGRRITVVPNQVYESNESFVNVYTEGRNLFPVMVSDEALRQFAVDILVSLYRKDENKSVVLFI